MLRVLPLFVVALSLATAAAPNLPSQARYEGPVEAFGRAADCAVCHEEEHAQWATSAHAHSSLDNPWYAQAFEDLRENVGVDASRHCAGCHDPVLLANGLVEEPITAEHPLATQGVACLVCHGIRETGTRGNGDYVVDLADLPDPIDSVKRHRQRMRPAPLEDGTVCRGCHRGFLTPDTGNRSVLPGFDDWGEWEVSGWAGVPTSRFDPPRDEPVRCIDCHMEKGHGVPGGRAALAAQTGGLDAVEAMLAKALKVRIPVAWVDGERARLDGGFAPEAGSEVVLDVTVRNVGAGHSFPGGTEDTQDSWLRVTVEGAKAVLVAGEGTDDAVHFRGLPVDEEGRPVRAHHTRHIASKAFDHTIPPGEVQLVRVAFTAPGGPLDVRAEVVHRSHRAELAEAACRATTDFTLDGCAPETPRTIAVGTLEAPDGAALYEHALGMSRGLQEEIGAGLDSLAGLDDPRARVVRARILGRQGRVDEALAELEGLPDHPAVWRMRGDALAAVWRWEPAVKAYREMVQRTPENPASWASLARALGSAGDAEGALEAADEGLAFQPRDPDLLRSRALALQDLEDPRADGALDAWLDHRRPDDAAQLRTACDRLDEECAAERMPIPTMRAVPLR
ncbi:MAG: hypothetical protein H6737_09100 [Alphaproteobacteria bacterium]|nr:hypothetical protein [Alphaproteobacteria bacterium]